MCNYVLRYAGCSSESADRFIYNCIRHHRDYCESFYGCADDGVVTVRVSHFVIVEKRCNLHLGQGNDHSNSEERLSRESVSLNGI